MTEGKSHPFYKMLASIRGRQKLEVLIDWWAVEILRVRVYTSGGIDRDLAPIFVFYVEKNGKLSFDGDHMKTLATAFGEAVITNLFKKIMGR